MAMPLIFLLALLAVVVPALLWLLLSIPVAAASEGVVEGKVILELKSVERVNNAHKKQLLTYLKLTGMKLGYLLNFGETLMKSGITRTVNDLEE